MSSFQDLIDASYRVKNSATEFEQRTRITAEQLRQHLTRLSSVGRGNRTVEGAVGEVARALRSVQETAAHLRALQRELGDFITYVSQ